MRSSQGHSVAPRVGFKSANLGLAGQQHGGLAFVLELMSGYAERRKQPGWNFVHMPLPRDPWRCRSELWLLWIV